MGPRRGTEILERISVHQQLSSFEMLKNANPTEVAALLQDEMPQTIALVLSYLEAKVAADILTSMSKENQVAVTLRLALPATMLAGVPLATAYAAVAWLCWLPQLLLLEWTLARRPAVPHRVDLPA